jgi:antitoxin MazE
MKSVLRKMGNSQGVIVPKPILAEVGVKPGDSIDIKAEKGRIVIAPVRNDPRAGWADECKALRDAGEAGLVWPEFANDSDKDLKW